MSAAKAAEQQIIRNVLNRREPPQRKPPQWLLQRLIHSASVLCVLALLGSYTPELMWALLAAGAVLTLGTPKGAKAYRSSKIYDK